MREPQAGSAKAGDKKWGSDTFDHQLGPPAARTGLIAERAGRQRRGAEDWILFDQNGNGGQGALEVLAMAALDIKLRGMCQDNKPLGARIGKGMALCFPRSDNCHIDGHTA